MPSGYTPIFRISRGGQDITSTFQDRLVSLTIERTNQDFADRVEITLDDRGWAIAFPSPGETIAVSLGYREIGMAYQGSFVIEETVLSGPPKSISISGSSVSLSSAFAAPIIAEFERKSLGEIVTSLAEKAGLTASVHPSVAALTLPFRNITTSPLAAVGELARLAGAVLKVHEGKVILAPRDAGVTAAGDTMPVVRLGPEHFGQWSVRHSNRTAHSEVEASYFDTDAQVRKWTSAGPEGRAFSSLLVGSNPFKLGTMYASEAEALTAAKAKMSSLVRGSGVFFGTLAAGDPWLGDQQRLEIAGMRDGVNGSYTIATVRHTYNESGLQTSIEANPSGLGEDYASFSDLENFVVPLPGEPIGRLIVGTNGQIAGGF